MMGVGLASAFGFESLGDVMVIGLELILFFIDHFDLVVEPGSELGAVFMIEFDWVFADEIADFVGHVLVDDFHSETGVFVNGSIQKLAKVKIVSLPWQYCGLAFGLAIHRLVGCLRFGIGGGFGVGETGFMFGVELVGFVLGAQGFKGVSVDGTVDLLGFGFLHVL